MVGEITGESIKSAISLKINGNFAITTGSPPVTLYPNIYKEQIIQGMEKPCFFIWQMDVSQERLRLNHYERVYQMNIRYHPKDDDLKKYETLSDMGNKLLEYLSTIDVPIFLGRYDVEGNPIEDAKPVRGTQMSFKINENVLQVYVTYAVKIKLMPEPLPLMSTLDINNQ